MKIFETEKKELTHEVDSMFQFVITVSIFILTFIDFLFRLANTTNSEQIGSVGLKWSYLPVILTISFVFFRIFKWRLSNLILTILNYLLLIEILFIITAVSVVMANGNELHSYFQYYLL